MPDQPERRHLQINGLRINYLDWGNPDAPPMVCVHGYTSSAESFNAFARHMRDRFHIVVPDVRGHGDSEWSAEGAYQYADQVADLEGFVDALALDRFALVGTSMGGLIGMTYAGKHPERLTHFVINDIGPDVEAGSARITQNVGARPDSFASLDEAVEFRRSTSANTAKRTPEDQAETAAGVLQARADGRWYWKLDPRYVSQRIEQGPPVRPPLWPALEVQTCPTAVVWGRSSDVLSEAQANKMVQTLKQGTLIAVADTEHAPALIEPESRAGLDAFFAR